MNSYNQFPARPADFDYDAALADIQEKIRRKKKAKTLLAHFTEEAVRLSSIVEDRFKEYEVEQEEADAMKSATLTLLLYSIMGLKEEKLRKEESEALAAKAEYESAKAELDHVLNRQVELRAEIRSLGNCERDYEEMVAEKKAWLMAKEVTVNGADFTKNGSFYVVTVDALVVADGRQAVTCVIYDANGNEVANATDSLESYTARKNGTEDIFVKMMQYSDSAYTYFHP